MKYKNVTEQVLNFRANDDKGIKQVFVLQPGEEMESDRVVSLGGIEEVKKPKAQCAMVPRKKIKIKKESDV